MLIKRYTILALLIWILLACEGCAAPVWLGPLMEKVERAAVAATENGDKIARVINSVKPGEGDRIGFDAVGIGGVLLGIISLLRAVGVGREVKAVKGEVQITHDRISKHKRETRGAAAAQATINDSPTVLG